MNLNSNLTTPTSVKTENKGEQMTVTETKVFNQFNEMSKAYPTIKNGDAGEDFTMELIEVEEDDESHYTFSLDLNNEENCYGFDMCYID